MRGAMIRSIGAEPVVEDDLPVPVPVGLELVVAIIAAAVNPMDLVIARGGLPGTPSPLPFVPGSEGVGHVMTEGLWHGKRVWFEARGGVGGHGSFAEATTAPDTVLVEVPPGVDSVVAARYGLAGSAAWLGLNWRARLRPGEIVAVLDATSPMGQIAVQAARILGARRVVAAAHGPEIEQTARRLGADATVRLDGRPTIESLTTRFRAASPDGLDVIIDPLWGVAARAALACANDGARLVQLGAVCSAGTELSASMLRPEFFDGRSLAGSQVSILGQAYAAVPPDVRAESYRQMIDAVCGGGITVPAIEYPLAQTALAYAQLATRPHHQIVIRI
ncbi:MAG: zinc-binding dehydrogenase [Nakamurella sp.]